jgi:hypothetical protein
MVNLSVLASIIGTSVLAITAFLSFRESRRQSKVMEKRLLHSIKISNPKLKINEFKFVADQLNLNIENVGESNAYDIALMADIFPYQSKDDGKNFVLEDVRQLKDEYGIKVIEMVNGVLFSYENYNRTYLEPKKIRTINFIPQFYIKYAKNSKSFVGRALDLKSLIEFSELNNLRYLRMDYFLIYKNSLSDTLTPSHICSFIMDLKSDPNLEAAYNAKRKFGGYIISYSEIGKQVQLLSYEEYKNLI